MDDVGGPDLDAETRSHGDARGEAHGAEQFGYDLAEWPGEARVLLDRLLETNHVARVWEAATLVVGAQDEESVDALIDQVEASEAPPLDPDVPSIVYDMEGLGEDERSGVADALTELGIPHGWDDTDDLVVYERDEEQVERILDEIEYPDALEADGPGDDDDGLAAQEVLSALFVATDRLRRNARDHQGVLALVDAADTVETLALPYGFASDTWKGLVERSVALRQVIEAGEAGDEELRDQADGLRRTLRPYI
jgi:hypothetical protein